MDLSRRYHIENHGPLSVGDVTFHDGWTLHASPAMPEGMETRYALTITYFADDGVGARATTKVLPKRLQKFVETEDEMAYKGWINELRPGQPLRHQVFEVAYDANCASDRKAR
mmetsp:Transcript_9379/g.23529  ORF Transcript_9379/g.23529 Transcript_9379/m.23529 type:complete len:113 (+) Transcript_9379:439-777(+)